MEQVRSFIAIELTEEAKACLRRLQSCLKMDYQPYVKWVGTDGIHLTLKFLGNVPAGKIGSIQKAMETACSGIPPFQLELRDTGAFPNLKRVQVIWVGVSGDTEKLSLLQKRIDSALSPLGFAVEARPFTPHLTLARLRESASPGERQEIGELITRTKLETPCLINVDQLSLMRSQLTREGAIYSRIGSVKLE